MREIKFRQRHKRDKADGWWYWGFLEGHGFVSPLSNTEQNYQFTGLHDKNGQEIYEGDVVRWKDDTSSIDTTIIYHQAIVEWEDVYVSAHSSKWSLSYKQGRDLKYTEVIGNIYENPDMVGGVR
jgi:uncharacterized phage protein (TIGR01671 family)